MIKEEVLMGERLNHEFIQLHGEREASRKFAQSKINSDSISTLILYCQSHTQVIMKIYKRELFAIKKEITKEIESR